MGSDFATVLSPDGGGDWNVFSFTYNHPMILAFEPMIINGDHLMINNQIYDRDFQLIAENVLPALEPEDHTIFFTAVNEIDCLEYPAARYILRTRDNMLLYNQSQDMIASIGYAKPGGCQPPYLEHICYFDGKIFCDEYISSYFDLTQGKPILLSDPETQEKIYFTHFVRHGDILYLAYKGGVYRWLAGEPAPTLLWNTSFNRINSLAVDTEGFIYLVGSGSSVIYRYASDGTVCSEIAIPHRQYKDIDMEVDEYEYEYEVGLIDDRLFVHTNCISEGIAGLGNSVIPEILYVDLKDLK
ncbi:MAG: hypothetical protein Q4P72_02400 [Eubacteriales bacterium]|nr:hypothetical protein [Eubacteriales bacterium]